MYSLFSYREFSGPNQKKSPPQPKSLLYERSEKWLSPPTPLPLITMARGGGASYEVSFASGLFLSFQFANVSATAKSIILGYF